MFQVVIERQVGVSCVLGEEHPIFIFCATGLHAAFIEGEKKTDKKKKIFLWDKLHYS